MLLMLGECLIDLKLTLQTAEKILEAPDLSDDFYLNLLDWGTNNILAIALGSTVYLWDASNSSTSELVTVSDDDGPVTSLSWAADGRHIALGLNNSCVELWDSISVKLVRPLLLIYVYYCCFISFETKQFVLVLTMLIILQLRRLRGHHERVGSLAWNKEILTTGSRDGNIINNDVRVRSHIVQNFLGHQQEVCGLKWSASGCQLASGGNDSLVFIWDRSFASPNAQWLHRLQDHTSAVKALAWCPFQANLLASGGGVGDDTIKFWNAHTGSCLNSVNTCSQVCALLWNSHERELLSSHGFTENQLIPWKYPSMVRLTELSGHTSRVLYMTQSPDGFTVASAADETLRFWNVFGVPEVAKPAPKQSLMLFSPRYNCIR